MKANFKAAVTVDRHSNKGLGKQLALAALLTLALPVAHTADPAGAKASGKAVTLEPIAGSTAKRVTLSARAAERLGIETGKVGEEQVIRKQMVSGLITGPVQQQPGAKPGNGTFGGFGQNGAAPALTAPANSGGRATSVQKVADVIPATGATSLQKAAGPGGFGTTVDASGATKALGLGTTPLAAAAPALPPGVGDAWVMVNLSPGEWERLAKDKPARLLALSTRDKLGDTVLAQPSGIEPVQDVKRSMLTTYFVVPGKDHGLTLNSRMRVELQVSGTEDKQKVVPYSAVYYDGKGVPWVYVNTKPLTYERQRIGVERVTGDLAILSDGPPIGTPVVTVGASMLFGAEIYGK
jgi:hypothetical protein